MWGGFIMKIILIIGGVFHFTCAVSHWFFPQIFQWVKNLESLPAEKSAAMLSTLNVQNWCLLIFWLALTYIPIVHADDLLNTRLGKTLLTCIVLFWVIRIFIFHPVFIGFASRESIVQVAYLSIGLVLFSIPWIKVMFFSK
jgi:hypothetical protein